MSALARCKNRPECKAWTCHHYGAQTWGIHEANFGCLRANTATECDECEAVAVVPVSVLRDAAVMICAECHGNDECGAGQPCEDMAALCAAIREAEEGDHEAGEM